MNLRGGGGGEGGKARETLCPKAVTHGERGSLHAERSQEARGSRDEWIPFIAIAERKNANEIV